MKPSLKASGGRGALKEEEDGRRPLGFSFAVSSTAFMPGSAQFVHDKPIACSPTEDKDVLDTGLIMAIALTGAHWVSEVNGQQTVAFDQGRVSGFAGCNRFFGSYNQQGDRISVSDLALTRKMCNPETMREERDWVRRLEKVASISEENEVLVLKDKQGKALARLKLQDRG